MSLSIRRTFGYLAPLIRAGALLLTAACLWTQAASDSDAAGAHPVPNAGAPIIGNALRTPDLVAASTVIRTGVQPSFPTRSSMFDFRWPFRAAAIPATRFSPAEAKMTIHGNTMYLSLLDGIALAIGSNLDVDISRYQVSIADTDLRRAAGGGMIRGLDYNIFESPPGVGGPVSPLLTAVGASSKAFTITDMTALNQFAKPADPWSVHSMTGYSSGPPVPAFDPSLIGQSAWFRRGDTIALVLDNAGAPAGLRNFDYGTTNLAFIKGFSAGGQVELLVNNASQAVFGSNSKLNPFSSPNISVTFAQPLLRGRDKDVNRRFVKIAQANQKVSKLLLYQQIVSTVYGVSRLYCDLVSLNENVEVKRQALAAARKLREDVSTQVEGGRLAPVEITRARALVSTAEMDLVQAEGLVSQQEVILKSQLTSNGLGDPSFRDVRIVPTDHIIIPPIDDIEPLDVLIGEAIKTRPDLTIARLEIEAGEMAAKASRNALMPSMDFVASYQTRAESQTPFQGIGTPGTGSVMPPPMLSQGGLIPSKIYQAGIQFSVPLRNRVAQADAARDALQLRQSHARLQRLENDIIGEIKNSVIALKTARAALTAATQTLKYQEALLESENKKLSVGASTHFATLQQQANVAQAQSTEVAARSSWIKAKIALERVLGTLLEERGVSLDRALMGQVNLSGARDEGR